LCNFVIDGSAFDIERSWELKRMADGEK
jgi:hypothetical protein